MRCPYLLCFVFTLCSIGTGLSGTGIAHAQAVPSAAELEWRTTLLALVDEYGPKILDMYTAGPKQPAASSHSSASASSSSPPPTKDEDPPSSSSSEPSCTCRDPSTEAPGDDPDLYTGCANLPPSAPTGAYGFLSRNAPRKRVLLYCKEGKTSLLNPSDKVPQYELRPPHNKLKDVFLPPMYPDLQIEFEGDCRDTRSPVGCANHSPLFGITTVNGTNFYMLRYHRCQSCATSMKIRIPNEDPHAMATELEINAFVYSSLNPDFPAVLKVHGDRYDQHESVGVSACQGTNRFANKEGCVCCGTNACFADTLRQPHNPSEEVTVPDNNSGLGYDLPVVRRNQPNCSPLAVDVSINGRPSAFITVLMSGKSGGHGGWPHSDQGFPAVGTGGDIYELWISKVYRPPKCTCTPAHKTVSGKAGRAQSSEHARD